ncbi:pentapeptide repeat protein [Leptospira santarosai str. 2000027870]|uniref:pentapeptide repeat-containing protein n=1 Tax=Leptospira santarosai TaxID=28183 RepID=UPI0002BD5CD5|nr:pentapeptide repeat-containing protein [Leptospira santarosai]EMM86475.1 pentapeptide repeat protein [Leptospira santarosai str. 2000027870]
MTLDLSVQEFVQLLQNGKKKFINVSIEDFDFTLRNCDLEEVEFENCFVNINLENCNLKNAKFISCNLKTIAITNCSVENCHITDCSIESTTIIGKNIDQIVFGKNRAYGLTLSPDQCALYIQSGI